VLLAINPKSAWAIWPYSHAAAACKVALGLADVVNKDVAKAESCATVAAVVADCSADVVNKVVAVAECCAMVAAVAADYSAVMIPS
jgi:hypothetical protein